MRRTFALVVSAVLLAGAACGDDSDTSDSRDDESAQSWPHDPIWPYHHDRGPGSVIDVAFHEDTAILLGSTSPDSTSASHANRLDVIDLTTGEVNWSLDQLGDHELPGGNNARWRSVGRPGSFTVVEHVDTTGWTVLVPYMTRTSDWPRVVEHGIAALDGETGEVAWEMPAIDEGLFVSSVVSDGETAVLLIAPEVMLANGFTYDLIAVDTADGSVLWETSGIANLSSGLNWGEQVTITNGVVMAPVPNDPISGDGDPGLEADVRVVAWDAATGNELWDLENRYPRSQVGPTAGELALVAVPGEPSDDDPVAQVESIALEAATGEEVISFGTHAEQCVGDDDSLIVCVHRVLDDQRLATLQVEDRDIGLSEIIPELPSLWDVHQEYIFASDDDTNLILDRAGNVLDDDPPGTFLAMSDRYILFTEHRGHGPFAIYPLDQ